MSQVKDIEAYLNAKIPFNMQENWDNSGFLIGDANKTVKRIFIALDITLATLQEAIDYKADLIITHHPIIFNAVKRITSESLNGQILLKLIENNIAVISCHTNLDAVQGGVNDILAQKCGLKGNLEILDNMGTNVNGEVFGIGRIGLLEKSVPIEDYIEALKHTLLLNGVRYITSGKPVFKVAVGGGACGSMMYDVITKGCDTFVTSDIKYNQWLDARDLGLNLIDAGHFNTENPVIFELKKWIEQGFSDISIKISQTHNEPIAYKI